MTLFLYGALGGSLVFLPLNLIQVQGYDAAQAGLSFLPFAILVTLLSRCTGAWADRMGPRLPLTMGPVIVGRASGAGAAGADGGPVDYWTTYFPGLLVLGVGMGITVAPLTTAVMGAVARACRGGVGGE